MGRSGAWLLVLVLLAGCSSAGTGDGQPNRVNHPPAAVPADRDEAAVFAALRQLDACALLDPVVAAVPGYPATRKPQPLGPHRCEIKGPEVSVILGDELNAEERFRMELVDLGGARAYRRAEPPCEVYLPVSFRWTIAFHGPGSPNVKCDPVMEFARSAAVRLTEPDRLRAAASMPMAEWDLCRVLTTALGTNPDGYTVGISGSEYGLDDCVADDGPGRSAPWVSLRVGYGDDPARRNRGTARDITIAGTPVSVAESGNCYVSWSNGPVGGVDPDHGQQVVWVTSPDCRRGEEIAAGVIAALRGSPPTSAVTPQRPVTYRPDEPDRAAPGACIDIPVHEPCEPYVDVPVPSGGAEIMRAAAADPNVICALSRAAIATHFGDRLTPVTSRTRCTFVEPTHAMRISIEVRPDEPLRPLDSRPGLPPVQAVHVAGHAGYTKEINPATGSRRELTVAANRDSDPEARPGTLTFIVTIGPPRGTTRWTPADAQKASPLEPAVADILTTHFVA